jgi:hypothetical protein
MTVSIKGVKLQMDLSQMPKSCQTKWLVRTGAVVTPKKVKE